MKKMSIKAKRGGVMVTSVYPPFKYHIEKEGQILELPKEHAEKLLQNEDLFEKAGNNKKKETKADYDLDGDGDVDQDDRSLMAKGLSSNIGK